jgi:hypothetical protein
MQSSSRVAFKEWAVVCAALAAGRQILILRKGGIHEGREGFRVRDQEFWLFPTAFHQDASHLTLDAQPLLEQVRDAQPPDGTIRISPYAVVHEVHELTSQDDAEALADLHIWSPRIVAERFHYRRPGLFALVVRMYNSPHAVDFADSPYFAGCRSWVDLPDELSTVGLTPVLSNEEFARQLAAVHEALPGSR